MSCGSKIEQSLLFNERGEVAVACLWFVGYEELKIFHTCRKSPLFFSNLDS